MQPIDNSKLSAEAQKIIADLNKEIISKEQNKNTANDEINNKLISAIEKKHRMTIGLLLKQTLNSLDTNALMSIDIQKAILSAKKIIPGEFAQLYIQDRVQQHKLAETLSSQNLKPESLTLGTIRQWFSGQLIQSIVYQEPQNNIASLLISKSGQYPKTIIDSSFIDSNFIDSSKKFISNDLIKQSLLVEIKTDLSLKTGQQLLLYVNKNASNISFQLLHPPSESHQVSQFINQFVTKQQALPQLLAMLKEISTQSNQANTVFTPQFKKQVDTVLQQFPQLSQLSSANEVKNSIHNSGTFLESKILNTLVMSSVLSSNNKTPLTNNTIAITDLKAGLSQLVTLIQNNQAVLIPKLALGEDSVYRNIAYDTLVNANSSFKHIIDLPIRTTHAQIQMPVLDSNLFQLNNHLLLQNKIREQLEGVLSRIIVNQLHTRESGEQSFLNFEIPFRHNGQNEVMQLKIREKLKNKEAQQGNKIWTVNLAFHLENLGGIRIYITLNKRELAIQFWTENQAGQHLFQNHFHLLSERLIDAGFSISQLTAFHGIPEQAEKEQKNNTFIIDERV